MSKREAKVAIVILNWNGAEDTIECLASLFKIDHKNVQIVVVDYGSTDDSVLKIKKFAQDRITLVGAPENLGFARGNNLGIKLALKDPEITHVLVLNNDIVVAPDFLTKMLLGFSLATNVALVGPKIIDYYSKKYWQGPAAKRLNVLTYLMYLTPLYRLFIKTPLHSYYLVKSLVPKKVYGMSGCCLLFKRECLEEIGLFDETTFLGSEEYIVAEKLLQRQLATVFVPDSVIYHKVAKDSKRISSAKKSLIMLESERYFLNNYLKLPFWQTALIRLVRSIIYLLLAMVNLK